MPIGKNLEVDVGVSRKNLQQVFVHERLTAQDPEEAIPHRLGLLDRSVCRIEFDLVLFRRDVDPAALAAEVATVDHRQVQERREELTASQSAFVLVDARQATDPERPSGFPKQSLVGFGKEATSHAKVHRKVILSEMNKRTAGQPL